MFRISNEVKDFMLLTLIAVFTIATMIIVIWGINQPKVEVDYTYNDYIEETIETGDKLVNDTLSLIASGELDEYYSDEELQALKALGIR